MARPPCGGAHPKARGLARPVAQSGLTPAPNQVFRLYYYAGSLRAAVRTLSGATGSNELYFLHADHPSTALRTSLGSTSLTTNMSQAIVGQQRYYAYGEPRNGAGTLHTDRRFTGQREESGLGSLYDYNARYYSPLSGRFISADSIVPRAGNPQSLNRYMYVYGNPLKYIDPSGHFTDQELIDFGVFSDMDAIKIWRNSSNPHILAWYYKLRAAQLGDVISGFVNRGFAEWTSESITFTIIDGRLAGLSASGELFGVFPNGFKSATTGDWMFTTWAGALTTTDGKRLVTLEQLRQHVLHPRAGSNVAADWVQIDLGGCYYVCLIGSKREDLYHQVYWSIAVGIGTFGPILAFTGGSLQTSYVPDASQLENHSIGLGITASGGIRGFGGVYNVASFGPDSHGGGLMWPGFSLVVSYSWK